MSFTGQIQQNGPTTARATHASDPGGGTPVPQTLQRQRPHPNAADGDAARQAEITASALPRSLPYLCAIQA